MPDGTQDTGTTTTTESTPWTASLPEPIRGNPAWKDVPDVGTLANKYLETRRPFAEQLPKDIAADASFKDIKDLDGLARSYHGQVKLLGVPKDQLLRLPTSDDPKDWDPIHNRLGRPEKPEGYKLTLPEGMKLNEETAKPIFEAAHKAGVSQKQLDALYTTMRGLGEQQEKAAKAKEDAAIAESMGALKTEFGAAYETKVADAIKVLDILAKETGTDSAQLKADLEKDNLGNRPALIKLLAGVAKRYQEDGLMGRASGTENLNSPTEARQNIAALQQDANFMKVYRDRNNVGHKDAVAKMEALYKQAYPEERAA